MDLWPEDEDIWQRLADAHIEYARAAQAFLAEGVDRVGIIHRALGSPHRHPAFIMLEYLKPAELIQLFDDLLGQASYAHGSIRSVRDAIKRIPRGWLLERIEEAVEPYLAAVTDDQEYRRFLELYSEIDETLTLKLARRAAAHMNSEIREAGVDFLEKLNADS